MKRVLPLFLALSLCLGLVPAASAAQSNIYITPQYLYAGAVQDNYTEESYRASPVVTDLDGDGRLEVITAAHSVVVTDAATGKTLWRVNSGHDRSTPFDTWGNTALQVFTTPVVADIDKDGYKEIVVAYGDGSVSVLNYLGYFKTGWPQKPTTASLRSLEVGDLDGDGKQEIVVGAGIESAKSVWVYQCNGAIRSGWPQLSAQNYAKGVNIHNLRDPSHPDFGRANGFGLFGDAITLGDLTGDGLPEIIVPTDTPFIGAFTADGTPVRASSLFEGRPWGRVGLFEDYNQELLCENEGWGNPLQGGETRRELYHGQFGHSTAVYTDVDSDGVSEIVVAALIADRTTWNRTNHFSIDDTRYATVYIFNQDRTRYVNREKGFDWTTAPKDLGRPLKRVDKTSVTGGVILEPVCEDVDGDGNQEIFLNSFNGKLHCFSLDGTEHGSWPFTLPKSNGAVCEFAAPPACVDIDHDGKKEVVVATWTDGVDSTDTGVDGAIYVLSHDGKLLSKQDLHQGYATFEAKLPHSNGVKAAPTVVDIDNDGKYEVLLNTTYYALCAYELDTQPAKATAATQAVLINGQPVNFHAYALKDGNGNYTNYVKLRDLVYAIRDTWSKYQVDWNSTSGMISLTPNVDYSPVGGEMDRIFYGDQVYQMMTVPLHAWGHTVFLDALVLTDANAGGHTYFKLRDLGEILKIKVDWDASLGKVTIKTS